MNSLALRDFHRRLGARFGEVNGAEVACDYGDWLAEHAALGQSAVLDLSFRGRLCLVGADRIRFLHGQVTNDVKALRAGAGCYAALVTAKGKMEGDLNIFNLADELLLDFEPGLTEKISRRLERFIVADEVQIVDAAPHYGLLTAQGPGSERVIGGLNLFPDIPHVPLDSVKISDPTRGEIYLMNHPRLRPWLETAASKGLDSSAHSATSCGFDLFVPKDSLAVIADKLIAAAKALGGRAAGWTAFEAARIEAGIPRFGADMDETNLPLECGIEAGAVSYRKGCYIGQEVINRIHSFGRVTKELCGLRLAGNLNALPGRHDKLFCGAREVGYVTSALRSPSLGANIALGYVRREAGQLGTELTLRTADAQTPARVVEMPFAKL
ncbi:MAG: aminomethyltransferase family protein [Verrucomicrobiota bacterium]|nr:aminomethyltransferase family protein [Verrucomicrobiota bacterium]